MRLPSAINFPLVSKIHNAMSIFQVALQPRLGAKALAQTL